MIRELKEVVETLFSKIKGLEKQIDVLTTALNERVEEESKKDKQDLISSTRHSKKTLRSG